MTRITRRSALAWIATAMCAASGCLDSDGRSSEMFTQYSAGVVTVNDGVAYFGTIEDIYAIDVETGNSVWTYQDAYKEIDQPPTASDDAVYVSENAGGGVHAISSGERVWYFNDLVGDASQPVPSGEVVYVNAGGTLYELDRRNGQIRRERALANHYPSTPIVRNDALYLVTGSELWSLDRSTFDINWTHEVAGSSEVAARDGRLFVSSQEHGGLTALDRNDGTLAWDTDLGHTQQAVVAGEGVYASERDCARVGAYSLDGTKRWTSGRARTPSVPAVGSDAVFAVDYQDSELLALERDTGERNWSFGIDAGLRYWPTNAPGRVFVPTDEGLLSIEK